MARLILLLAIIVVVALVVRRALKAPKAAASSQDTSVPAGQASEAKLVRCVECGAFVPKAEAVAAPNGFRCGAGCAPR